MRSRQALLAVAALATSGGCARTINLLQPDWPRFEGTFEREADGFAPAPLQVVTFNVKLSRFPDRAIAVLESPALRGADIVALQEMDEATVDRIARALRLDYVYFPAAIHPTERRHFGPALLSRWPIDSAWKLILPHAAAVRGQRRTATAATIVVRGVRVRVYAVHLEVQSRLTPNEYLGQAAALVEDAARWSGPVVLAGDFNGYEIGRFFEARGFRWPTRQVGRTSFFFSIDHIFVRGLAVADSAPAGAVREVLGASDHRPVWARLFLPAEAAAFGASPP